MSEAAAQAPVGAAPGPTAAPVDRLKAFLSAPASDEPAAPPSADVAREAQSEASSPADAGDEVPDPKPVPAKADQEEGEVDEAEGDAQSEEVQLSTLSELADATGLEVEKLLGLELPVKIDGKEGTARIRDLVKSYQLDGHINQRLASVDAARKEVEAERQRVQTESADKLLKLDAAVKTAERVLMGKFSQVDWQKLAAEDPNSYYAKFHEFQQHNAEIQDAARAIAEQQAQLQQQQQAAYQAHLTEQKKLLESAIPEWMDASTRTKDKAEMAALLKAKGAPEGVMDQLTDAWQASVVLDALRYDRLMKTKPQVLNKVKAAPKLLKPGTQASRAATESLAHKQARERLKQSGRHQDADLLIRRALFGR